MEIESLLGATKQSKSIKDVIRVQFETTYSIFAKHRCIIYVCIPPSHTQRERSRLVIHPTVGCHGDAASEKEILEFRAQNEPATASSVLERARCAVIAGMMTSRTQTEEPRRKKMFF